MPRLRHNLPAVAFPLSWGAFLMTQLQPVTTLLCSFVSNAPVFGLCLVAGHGVFPQFLDIY